MSETDNTTHAHLERWLLDQWAQRLGQSLDTMTGEMPVVEVSPEKLSGGPPAPDTIWWKQCLSLAPGAIVWVGAPQGAWAAIGGKVLQSAGIEESSQEDQRGSYLEILQQALSGLAQALTGLVRKEVLCDSGAESTEPPEKQPFDCLVSSAGSGSFSLLICFEDDLMGAILETQKASDAAESPADSRTRSKSPGSEQDIPDTDRTIDLLYDVELPVSISFGRAHLALKEVLKLTSGSIVELNRAISEPVEVIVNNCVIARGEVVVVDGNYGVRVNQIVSRRERLRTLH